MWKIGPAIALIMSNAAPGFVRRKEIKTLVLADPVSTNYLKHKLFLNTDVNCKSLIYALSSQKTAKNARRTGSTNALSTSNAALGFVIKNPAGNTEFVNRVS